ncbi:lipase maturation factor family protein [Corallococcus sicarius]|uniref:Lipase maturation factor family protein n=1 Tax=Corallococcus sicarius TaxID=2316726 RepID=A0A3A8MZ23_9BACT|nr:lipase maturation factor family protein [Corallococcus sicarius]RKH32912.1 lipase maturation factor family protein [Corallococcus sicarius]
MPEGFHAPDLWLARLVLQRGLGFCYLLAFLVALAQFRPLLGEHGLLPVPRFLARARFRDAPSVFHLRYSDRLLVAVALVGILLSLTVVLGLPDAWPVPLTIATWLVLWALYLSIVNVGQTFYSFGWESLLLEAGFLVAFLGPAWSAVPAPVLWLFRWLLFRVEFGAGLIKLRGDPCWRDLTCLDYHHETQPMPNPLSWYFHRMPRQLHRMEVLGSHFAQLVAPFLLFFPQPIATFAGLFIALTQMWLLLSGNYSWLNLITILLAASALDGAVLGHVLPPGHVSTSVVPWHDGLVLAVTVLLVVLSYQPARNLLAREQLMNASFEPLRLVNTYGAFGSVTRERYEVVIEGTNDERLTPATEWREYEFRGKPGDPKRHPSQWAPYHLRLDWLMWFAALSPAYPPRWFPPFIEKLLRGDAATLRLLRHNPFPEHPPRTLRAVLYRYRFTTWQERRDTGAWWERTRLGDYFPPTRLSA